MWIYTDNKLTKLHGNMLSLSENIAKSFRGATFFDSHCILSKYMAKRNGDKTEPWRTPKFITNSADQQSFHLTHA